MKEGEALRFNPSKKEKKNENKNMYFHHGKKLIWQLEGTEGEAIRFNPSKKE